MSEPTAHDRETAEAIRDAWIELATSRPRFFSDWLDLVARALAAERARVEHEVSGYSVFLSCCRGAKAHVEHQLDALAYERDEARAKLERLLGLTPEEAGRLLYGSACCGQMGSLFDFMKDHYNETATNFLAALRARVAVPGAVGVGVPTR